MSIKRISAFFIFTACALMALGLVSNPAYADLSTQELYNKALSIAPGEVITSLPEVRDGDKNTLHMQIKGSDGFQHDIELYKSNGGLYAHKILKNGQVIRHEQKGKVLEDNSAGEKMNDVKKLQNNSPLKKLGL